jgi:hypothetical protein
MSAAHAYSLVNFRGAEHVNKLSIGGVDADGAMIRAQAASLEAEHPAIGRDVPATEDFWGWASNDSAVGSSWG